VLGCYLPDDIISGGEVTEYLAEVIIIPVGPTEDDSIRVYLDVRLIRCTEPDAMDNDLRRDKTVAVNKKENTGICTCRKISLTLVSHPHKG